MKKTVFPAVLTAIALLLSGSAVFAAPIEASAAHIDAENEDSGLVLWFDYSSEKAPKGTAVNTGMESFTVYMAKNEIENAQFFLAADTAREGMTASVGTLTNESGNTLDAEIFIEYYHSCGSYGQLPDAIPPLSAYGVFALEAGVAQGFIVKLKTTPDTPAGLYSGRLSVYDSASREVKAATLQVKVWDFALSEETACATSMNLSYNHLSQHVKNSALTTNEIYENYYNYMLENRVCAYYLPKKLTSSDSYSYMDNPRVTSYQYASTSGTAYNSLALKSIFNTAFKGEENAHRFDKAYYFSGVVDSDEPKELEELRQKYDSFYSSVSAYVPDYATKPFNFISTYIFDIDYTKTDGTVIDQIEYYSDFVNLWCSKTFAYTAPQELSVPGAKLLQPSKWDSVYGTFSERMAARREAGQKVWWFISWDVTAPYINYYMQTDGVAQRVLFWQQYDNGVQGFLYNFSNFWQSGNAYENLITNTGFPDAYGESVLIYPGDVYGLDIPVGSLRLEAMRDGIEDYQMFYMLEEAKGAGAADALIDRMTTGMVTYSTDDAEYYEARKALGAAVESALNGCEHEYQKGICTKCGAFQEVTPADVNFDGKVNIQDLYLTKLVVKQLKFFNDNEKIAADMNKDNKINLQDLYYIRLKIKGL